MDQKDLRNRLACPRRSSRAWRNNRDFRQPVRYARREYASLPTSRDPVCEHHLVSCRIGITAESARQEKSALTYVPINRPRNRGVAAAPAGQGEAEAIACAPKFHPLANFAERFRNALEREGWLRVE